MSNPWREILIWRISVSVFSLNDTWESNSKSKSARSLDALCPTGKKKSYSQSKIHSESFVSYLSTLWNTASLWLGPLRFYLINEIISASRAAPSQKCLQQQKKLISAHRFNSLSSQQTSVNIRSQSVLERGSKSQTAQSCNMNHSEALKDFIISIGDIMELKTNEQHQSLLVLFSSEKVEARTGRTSARSLAHARLSFAP